MLRLESGEPEARAGALGVRAMIVREPDRLGEPQASLSRASEQRMTRGRRARQKYRKAAGDDHPARERRLDEVGGIGSERRVLELARNLDGENGPVLRAE